MLMQDLCCTTVRTNLIVSLLCDNTSVEPVVPEQLVPITGDHSQKDLGFCFLSLTNPVSGSYKQARLHTIPDIYGLSKSKMRLIVVVVHDCWFLDRYFSFTLLLLRISRGFEMEGFHTVYVERQPEVLVRSIRSLQCSIGIFFNIIMEHLWEQQKMAVPSNPS